MWIATWMGCSGLSAVSSADEPSTAGAAADGGNGGPAQASPRDAAPVELPTLDTVEVVDEVFPAPTSPSVTSPPSAPVRSYASRDQITGTRVEAPVRDLPQSITVIPAALVDDLSVRRTDDALPYVPGVQLRTGFGGRWDDYSFRGFPVWTANAYRDGFLYGYAGPSATDTVNVERIEVLRGPGAVLYGPGLPGGTLNYVTRVPEFASAVRLGASVGSFDTYRAEVDATGALAGSDRFAYRAMASAESTGGARDFNRWNRWLVNPRLRFVPGPRTTIDLEAQAYRHRYRADPLGVPLDVFEDGDIPTRRSYTEPTLPLSDMRGGHATVSLEHAFRDNLTFTVAVQSKRVGYDESAQMALGIEPDGRTLDRLATRWWLRGWDAALQSTLRARFDTGPLEHRLVVGLDARYERVSWRFGMSDPSVDLHPIDLFTPLYGTPIPAAPFPSGAANTWTYGLGGAYVNDVVEVVPELRVMVGARLDAYGQRSETGALVDSRSQLTPTFRAGAVWDVVDALALYGSVQRGFWPVLGVSATGTVLAPERSWAAELGLRVGLPRDALTVDAAFFWIDNRNISVPDPMNPDFQVQRGRARSIGAEAQLTVRLGAYLRGLATYAFTEAEVTEDPDASRVGTPLSLTARHAGSAWAQLTAPRGSLEGLGMGVGLVATGSRALADGTDLRGYARVDGVVSFDRPTIRVSLRAENLFDARYVRAGQDRGSVLPGSPRGLVLRVEARL